MAKYRILTLDGGGIRGLITVVMMQNLAKETGMSNWLDKVNLVAGTSTGGILALAIAKGVDLNLVRQLYETKGKDVFDDSFLDNVLDLATVIGAEYSNKKLAAEIKKVVGDNVTLGQLKRHVLVTAFDLDNKDPDPAKRTWKPKIFHNVPGKDNDAAIPAYKAALYTSAAPTFFPVVDGYVDGGVFANNPSMCAVAQTQDERNTFRPEVDDIVLLSLGTGSSLTYIKGENLNWGYAQWVKPLISLMMDGVNGIAHYQCKQLLGGRYNRLAPVFPPGVSMGLDDVERAPEMVKFANDLRDKKHPDWLKTVAWMKDQWMKE
jgi:patatin-like phospholipase/acyl hydrolase